MLPGRLTALSQVQRRHVPTISKDDTKCHVMQFVEFTNGSKLQPHRCLWTLYLQLILVTWDDESCSCTNSASYLMHGRHGLVMLRKQLEAVCWAIQEGMFAFLDSRNGTSHDGGCRQPTTALSSSTAKSHRLYFQTRIMMRTTGGRYAAACHKYRYADACFHGACCMSGVRISGRSS